MMMNVNEYINAIDVAAKLSGNFLDQVDEEWEYLNQHMRLEYGKIKVVIVCSEQNNGTGYRRVNGYGKLIFRFYEDKWGKYKKMSVCDYFKGILSIDPGESLEILGKYL